MSNSQKVDVGVFDKNVINAQTYEMKCIFYGICLKNSVEQSSPVDLVVQIVLIAESVRLQQMLATYGIQTQTAHQIEPMQIWPPGELVKAYEQLGVNNKLNLTGRPARPFGGLGTAKVRKQLNVLLVGTLFS